MKASRMLVILWLALLAGPTALTQAGNGTMHSAARDRARVALSHALPRLDGSHLQATVVEVHYGPGESSPRHSHPCSVIGYVVAGTLRTQVQGEPEATYKVGDAFYEPPNGLHVVSANASQSEPATFIAYFICDRDQPLSTNVPEGVTPKGLSR